MTNEEIITQMEDLKCHCQEMYEAEIKNGDTSSSIWGKDVEALDFAIKALEQTRWIPVSERLPEEDGFYLATCDGEICGEDEPISGMAEFENGKWVDDEDDYQCVLAWMPLPEPYKKNESQNTLEEDPRRCEKCIHFITRDSAGVVLCGCESWECDYKPKKGGKK